MMCGCVLAVYYSIVSWYLLTETEQMQRQPRHDRRSLIVSALDKYYGNEDQKINLAEASAGCLMQVSLPGH
jgi:hypothetical protein